MLFILILSGLTPSVARPNPTKTTKNLSPESAQWSQIGHRVVGDIANKHICRRTKRKIKKILGTESIAISSNWADFIKSDSAMNYLDPWHYINVKSGMNYTDFDVYLQRDTSTDAFTKLNFMIAALKHKQTPLEQKRFYLRLLIHIVGDIHQPLHVGRKEDLGGNKIYVMWFNERTNLHAVWDEKLITYQRLSYTEFSQSINFSTKEQRQKWQKQPMTQWLFESYQLADMLYKDITEKDQKLGYRYNFDRVDILNQQLLKGGIRLAGLLNEIFG